MRMLCASLGNSDHRVETPVGRGVQFPQVPLFDYLEGKKDWKKVIRGAGRSISAVRRTTERNKEAKYQEYTDRKRNVPETKGPCGSKCRSSHFMFVTTVI